MLTLRFSKSFDLFDRKETSLKFCKKLMNGGLEFCLMAEKDISHVITSKRLEIGNLAIIKVRKTKKNRIQQADISYYHHR